MSKPAWLLKNDTMVDVVNRATRSRMMSGIKGKNTQPELLIRQGLHRLGFRYSLHNKKLPGKPDMVFGKYKAVIFIHGCFWHAHNCHLFKWPSTRPQFWREKIGGNTVRDKEQLQILNEQGWRVLIIWECALKGKNKLPIKETIHTTANWLQFDNQNAEISSRSTQ